MRSIVYSSSIKYLKELDDFVMTFVISSLVASLDTDINNSVKITVPG